MLISLMRLCGSSAFPKGDPPPVWQLPRQADPQSLPGQIQPQEDEEVRILITSQTVFGTEG